MEIVKRRKEAAYREQTLDDNLRSIENEMQSQQGCIRRLRKEVGTVPANPKGGGNEAGSLSRTVDSQRRRSESISFGSTSMCDVLVIW